jgi:structural maintenance of chromosome 3 (chondroitin sulfate proteoglycan 6)
LVVDPTEARRNKILEIISYIDERLRELDEEKEELNEYQRLDKDRRCLEFAIYDLELNDVIRKIQEV